MDTYEDKESKLDLYGQIKDGRLWSISGKMDTYKDKESKLNLYVQSKDGKFFYRRKPFFLHTLGQLSWVCKRLGGHVPTMGLVPVILCIII